MKDSQLKPGQKLIHRDGEVFHLFPGQHDGMDSVVPIRWCICPEELKKLKDEDARNLHMLIIVKGDNDGPEERYVIPFNKEMVYITLRRPGKHYVSATIIWCPDASISKMKKWLKEKHSHRCYENILLSGCYEEEDISSFNRPDNIFYHYNSKYNSNCKSRGEETLELEVDTKFFAKEPPAWLKTWGNLWFETKPIDQCHFRKRCISAFTIQPPIMLLCAICIIITRLVIATWFILLGKRINLVPIVRPFKFTNYEIYRNTKRSIFLNPFAWMFSPITWVILLVLAVITRLLMMKYFTISGLSPFWANFAQIPFKQFLLFGIGYAILIGVAICIIEFAGLLIIASMIWVVEKIVTLCKKIASSRRAKKRARSAKKKTSGIGKWLSKKLGHINAWLSKTQVVIEMAALRKRKSKEAKKKVNDIGEWISTTLKEGKERNVAKEKAVKILAFEKEYAVYEEISCPGVAQEASIAALPKKRRTVSLRFHALKRRVCKPFAQ